MRTNEKVAQLETLRCSDFKSGANLAISESMPSESVTRVSAVAAAGIQALGATGTRRIQPGAATVTVTVTTRYHGRVMMIMVSRLVGADT